jgi:ribulose 1,5-bisphosphate synthetase/thiazole synthase
MDNLNPRSRLTDELSVDVAILGPGYSGLWTAYYLRAWERKPLSLCLKDM